MEPLACPSCHREGRQVLVEGLASWISHAREVHKFNNDARPRSKFGQRRVRNLWHEGGQAALQAALDGRHPLPRARGRAAVIHEAAPGSSVSDIGESDEEHDGDIGCISPMLFELPSEVPAIEPATTDAAGTDPRLIMSGS